MYVDLFYHFILKIYYFCHFISKILCTLRFIRGHNIRPMNVTNTYKNLVILASPTYKIIFNDKY